MVLGATQARGALVRERIRDAVQRFPWQAIEPLWVSGMALGCYLIGRFVFGTLLSLHSKTYDWALYMTLGTVFPALILLVGWPRQSSQRAHTIARVATPTLALLFLLVSGYLLVGSLSILTIILAAAECAIFAAWIRQESTAMPTAQLCVGCFVIALSWLAALRVFWWEPPTDLILRANYAFLVFTLVFVLSNIFVLARESATLHIPTAFPMTLFLVVGLLLIGMASLRTVPTPADYVGKWGHWSVAVGPAEMIRQGGWLLWDTPAQYGFLSTLTVAALPIHNVWESMYLLNAALLFLTAVFVFVVFRSFGRGWFHQGFALFIAIVSVFLTSGVTNKLLGPDVFPSIGPFRYFWCYALLAVLFWERRVATGTRLHRCVLVLGSVTWLLGTLWSAESAAFCAAIWLPVYTVLVIRDAVMYCPERGALRQRLREIVVRLALPRRSSSGLSAASCCTISCGCVMRRMRVRSSIMRHRDISPCQCPMRGPWARYSPSSA